MKTLHELSNQYHNVLVRVDWNVPTRSQQIEDPSRITSTLPTVQSLLEKGHRITLISHRGQPKSNSDTHLSLSPLLNQIEDILGHSIHFIPNPNELGTHWEKAPIHLFENLRFFHGETTNDPQFAYALASGAHAYVNDAFSVSHRAHASVDAITHYLPCFAGNLLEKELKTLDTFLSNPSLPLVAICGGAKINTKVGFIEQMLDKASTIALVGGIANTFWAAKGINVGQSLVDRDSLTTAHRIIEHANHNHCTLWLPQHVRVATHLDAPPITKHVTEMNPDEAIFDIAPSSYACLLKTCQSARTIIWNGALGVFEHPSWSEGTFALSKGLAHLTQTQPISTLAGGGETAFALSETKCLDKLTYVSMAGGAFMDYISGIQLPGVEALRRKWRTQEESNP